METTFITIHDLSLDARILYVSTSIEDILGYSPQEVIGRSCWEYFHPDEIPFARAIHGRGVQLDKAAVLNYCQIKDRDGRWVGCECVFTIVHDVLVGCTSVYRRGLKSHKRAKEAPVIRQLFSSSPKDPRYHMLSYISQKFEKPTRSFSHEPRAALFLNRFSRTLTIMYATNGLADALGISSNELCGKSFYYCIQENCLREAVKCLESAKANDSIAYLRFWFRDPRQDGHTDQDEHMSDGHSSGDEDDGGVHLSELMEHEGSENAVYSDSSNAMRSSVVADNGRNGSLDPNSRTSSGDSTDMGGNSSDAIFDQRSGNQQSRTSSISTPDQTPSEENPWSREPSQIELEAVVSCTSDGLVVVLRRAKPFLPQMSQATSDNVQHPYANGYFASPWAADPILPDEHSYSHQALPHLQPPSQPSLHPTASRSQLAATKGPATEDFMNSIREVAVFAWSLTGINGSLEQYARGTPSGESQPPGGLPIWDPHGNAGTEIYRPLGGVYTTDDYGQPYPSQKKIGYPDSRSVDHTNYTAGDLASNGNLAHTYNSGAYAQSHSNGNVDHTYDQRQHQDNGFSNGYSNGLNATNGDAFESSNGYGVGSGAHDHHSNGQSNGTWSPQFQQHQGWDASHHPGNGSNGHMTNNEARGYG